MSQQPLVPADPAGPTRLLALGAAGLGIVIYLVGFFAGFDLAGGVIGPLLVGGGLLVGATVLPKAGRVLLPGAVAVTVGMLLLLQAVAGGGASTSEVIALVLAFLQAVAAVGAVLLDAGIVTAPAPRPKAPPAPPYGGYPQGYGQPPYGQAPGAYGQPGYGAPAVAPDQPPWAQQAGTSPVDQPPWAQPPRSEPSAAPAWAQPPGAGPAAPWYAANPGSDATVATPAATPGTPQAAAWPTPDATPAAPGNPQAAWPTPDASPAASATPHAAARPTPDAAPATPLAAWPAPDATATIRPVDTTPATGQHATPAADDEDSATTRFLPSSDESRRN